MCFGMNRNGSVLQKRLVAKRYFIALNRFGNVFALVLSNYGNGSVLKKRVAFSADAFLLRTTQMSKIGKHKKVDPAAVETPKDPKPKQPKDPKPKTGTQKRKTETQGDGETGTKKKKGEKANNKDRDDIIKALTEMKEDEGDEDEDGDEDLEE